MKGLKKAAARIVFIVLFIPESSEDIELTKTCRRKTQ